MRRSASQEHPLDVGPIEHRRNAPRSQLPHPFTTQPHRTLGPTSTPTPLISVRGAATQAFASPAPPIPGAFDGLRPCRFNQVDELLKLNKKIDLIASYIPAVKKLYELLMESQSYLDNRRHEIIRVIAKTVEAQAEAMKDDSLLGKYEQTRRYRSATAIKAARTRKKKAAAASASMETAE